MGTDEAAVLSVISKDAVIDARRRRCREILDGGRDAPFITRKQQESLRFDSHDVQIVQLHRAE